VEPQVSFLEAFKSNPLPILLVLLLAAAGLVIGGAALVMALTGRGGRALAAIALVFGLLSLGVGAGGYALARSMVEAALTVPGLSSSDRARLKAQGDEEAAVILRVAFFAATPSLLLGIFGIVRGGKKKT
jgi:hypothetical protein